MQQLYKIYIYIYYRTFFKYEKNVSNCLKKINVTLLNIIRVMRTKDSVR